MTSRLRALLTLPLAAVFAACAAPALPFISQPAATMDGGHSISMSAYDLRLKLYRALHDKQSATGAATTPALDTPAGHADLVKLQDRAITDLVDEELLREEAERQKLTVTESDVNAQVDAARKSFPNEAAFQKALVGYGYNLDQLREQLRGRLTEVKVENAAARVRILKARDALRSGQDFAAVVKAWSDFKATSGDGSTTLTPDQLGQLDPLVKPQLDAIPAGQTSAEPARGQRGFYLFKVLSRDDTGVKVDLIYVFGPDADHYRTTGRAGWFDTYISNLEKAAHVHYLVGSKKGA